jgi:hypothetical protein
MPQNDKSRHTPKQQSAIQQFSSKQSAMGKGEGRGRGGWGLTSMASWSPPPVVTRTVAWTGDEDGEGRGVDSTSLLTSLAGGFSSWFGAERRRPPSWPGRSNSSGCVLSAMTALSGSGLGLGQRGARGGNEGKKRRSAGRIVMWLSVNYVWRIMCNMRHAYLTLSQIARPQPYDKILSMA